MKNNTTLTIATVNTASYKELQAMCKANNLKASGKTEELRERLAALFVPENAVPVGDLPNTFDNAPVMDVEPESFKVTQKDGMAIARRIVYGGKDRNGKYHSAAMFKATKSKDASVNGKWMITMSKLYAIIADVYGVSKDDNKTIKEVINYLCEHGWLSFKRYESGALSFFPTVKMAKLFS